MWTRKQASKHYISRLADNGAENQRAITPAHCFSEIACFVYNTQSKLARSAATKSQNLGVVSVDRIDQEAEHYEENSKKID